MKSYIYVVEGYTGEYEDYGDWPICAYMKEKDAKAHTAFADQWAKDHNVYYDQHSTGIGGYVDRKKVEELKPAHDPGIQIDYTGVGYRYYKVEVKDRWKAPIESKKSK